VIGRAAVLALAVAGTVHAAGVPDALTRRLDALVRLERPAGGWTFAPEVPGARPAPATWGLGLAERVAEPLGLADWDLIVVRSPGTPAAGLALLDGHRLTGRAEYLAAARRAGDLLVALQLRSGGWFSEMPAEGAALPVWFPAVIPGTPLDDDATPGAIRFLLALWEATGEARYRGAAERGLAFLVDSQLANGAWPLIHRAPWRRLLHPTYEDLPTTNDGATPFVIETLLVGARLLDRPDLRAAAVRGGEWLVRVQGAPPRAGWAAQYDGAGRPARGRPFEPPALASWESRWAAEALAALAGATGDARWCAPVARAADWFARAAIAPGCWARFYAPATGAPLYLTRDGAPVDSPARARPGYSWTGDYGIPALLARLGAVPEAGAAPVRLPGDPGSCDRPAAPPGGPPSGDPRVLAAEAATLLAALAPPAPMPCAVPAEGGVQPAGGR
jgi:Pectic acid lyase